MSLSLVQRLALSWCADYAATTVKVARKVISANERNFGRQRSSVIPLPQISQDFFISHVVSPRADGRKKVDVRAKKFQHPIHGVSVGEIDAFRIAAFAIS
jgi:hypothetical protein